MESASSLWLIFDISLHESLCLSITPCALLETASAPAEHADVHTNFEGQIDNLQQSS